VWPSIARAVPLRIPTRSVTTAGSTVGDWASRVSTVGVCLPLLGPFKVGDMVGQRRSRLPVRVLDIPFTPDTDGRWTHKRHVAQTESLEDVIWVGPDGLRYAKPEVTLNVLGRTDSGEGHA
jgi:hypothetical protein